jgi:type II secretory ATPase GspE/PulE/Tfp pilus assembly ATPase PilB-like protein
MNIGVPNYLMAGSIICSIAQRLSRKLCDHCKTKQPLTEKEKQLLGEKYAGKVTEIYKAVGCDKCTGGYKGRVAITEILAFDRELDELITNSASRKEMYNYAIKNGFVPMVEDGISKVLAGITDLDELVRVIDMTGRMS